MIYRLLGNLIYKILSEWDKKLPKCERCKTVMQKKERPRLFLLPVFHDAEYTPSREFYLARCKPINNVGEIPTGQRACRFWELFCPECAQRKILVEDFLQVRGTEVVEQRNLYNCADFTDMLMFTGQ